MTDDDICGAPTADDTACQHPTTDEGDPGRCWVPGHNDEPSDQLDGGGRPTKFTDERARAAVDAARKSLSKAGCARAAGVAPNTLENWLDKPGLMYESAGGDREEFLQAFRHARNDGELTLVQGGLLRDEIDSQHARFLLSTSFDYVKTEAREVSGPDGGPIQTEEVSDEELAMLEAAFDDEPET